MNVQVIPNEDNIVRYVPPSKISVKNGKRILLNDAFLPREDHPPGTGPEKYVSVDWLEYFREGNLRQKLDQIREILLQVRRFKRISAESKFAIVRVQIVKDAGTAFNRSILVQTRGNPHDPSHSGIYGLTPEDDIITQEIANRAQLEDV